ncbi:MAG TPA: hypothetical protein VMY37_18955 [Thermoguttaceae bacterium]|nr:hypothetical protein [Thermoguttaceae bacterium]
MANGGDYVTQVQFSGTMTLLQEIRTDIKGDVADLREVVIDMKKEITDRQDIANGRTSKNELAVSAAKAQLEAVQATVTHIDSHGCNRIETHTTALGALRAAGVAPAGSGWKPTTKQVGIAAGASAGLIAALEILKAVVTHFWK